MKIETITNKNVEIACEIYLNSWRESYQGIIPQYYLNSLTAETWKSSLLNATHKSFLLSDKNQYAAAASVSAARDGNMPDWGEIKAIYVHPDCFRKGYGRILLSYAKEQLKQDGFNKIYLWVLEKNFRAVSFYKAMGFYANGNKKDAQFGNAVLREICYTNTY